MKDRLAELSAVSVFPCSQLHRPWQANNPGFEKSHTNTFFPPSKQSRTQTDEDVAVTVDRDGFMENFFRRVGITGTSRMCPGFSNGTIQDAECLVDVFMG